MLSCVSYCFFFEGYVAHRDLHVRTHSFPTRRSSDLRLAEGRRKAGRRRLGVTIDGRRGACGHAGDYGTDCIHRCTLLQKLTHRFARTTPCRIGVLRSEEHTSELQSLMRISYAVFCLKKKKITKQQPLTPHTYK